MVWENFVSFEIEKNNLEVKLAEKWELNGILSLGLILVVTMYDPLEGHTR